MEFGVPGLGLGKAIAVPRSGPKEFFTMCVEKGKRCLLFLIKRKRGREGHGGGDGDMGTGDRLCLCKGPEKGGDADGQLKSCELDQGMINCTERQERVQWEGGGGCHETSLSGTDLFKGFVHMEFFIDLNKATAWHAVRLYRRGVCWVAVKTTTICTTMCLHACLCGPMLLYI